jgi:hypothetical protein
MFDSIPKLRTTRMPARLLCTYSVSLPSVSCTFWVRANIFPEKVRVSSISSGTVVNDTSVIFGEMASMTCSALASANTMLMRFITPNPVSSRIWPRSDVARLMISPADSRR